MLRYSPGVANRHQVIVCAVARWRYRKSIEVIAETPSGFPECLSMAPVPDPHPPVIRLCRPLVVGPDSGTGEEEAL